MPLYVNVHINFCICMYRCICKNAYKFVRTYLAYTLFSRIIFLGWFGSFSLQSFYCECVYRVIMVSEA